MNIKLNNINLLSLLLSTLIISSSLYGEEDIKRISSIDKNKKYEMTFKGMIYFDKPISTGASVSNNIAKFKKFDIDNTFSDDFYGGYFQFEHNFFLLPQIKTQLSSYSFDKKSNYYEEDSNGNISKMNYYSKLSTEEQNFMAYWELLEGNDMQLNVGGQYKILKGKIKNENLTTHSNTVDYAEATFEKYMPMIYLRGDSQFANGIEISNELSIGLDKDNNVFENTISLNYYTKIGLVGMVGYKYKHQEFTIKEIQITNNTHSFIVGLGYQY